MSHFNLGYGDRTSEKAQKLADLLKEINVKVKEAETFAKENNLDFRAEFGYGGNATFGRGSINTAQEWGIKYDEKDTVYDEEYEEDTVYFWRTSTMSC